MKVSRMRAEMGRGRGRSRTSRRSGWWLAGILALATIVSTACGGAGQSQAASGDWRADADRTGILTVAARLSGGYTSKTYDPIRTVALPDIILGRLIFGTLIDKNPAGEPTPWLVESWSQPDATTLDLKIRPGVTFHDGTVFDAAAVKAGLDRNRGEGSAFVGTLSMISSTEVLDPLTLRVTMSRPAGGNLLLTLSGREGLIPAAASIANPDSMATKPIGAGPFVVEESRQGESVKLRAYPGYYDKDQFLLGGIDMTNVNDDVAARNAVLSGTANFGFVDAEGISALQSSPSTGVEVLPSPAEYFLNLNLGTTEPPISDPLVRRAIYQAINREQITSSVVGVGGQPAWQMFREGEPGNDPALNGKYTYDPQAAKSLLAQAGYPDGFAMKLYTNSSAGPEARTVEVVAANLGEIGIKVEIVTGTDFIQDFAVDHKAPAAMQLWQPRADPTQTFRTLFGDGIQNSGKYRNDQLNNLVLQAQGEADQAQAGAILQQASQIVTDQALSVPIVFIPSRWGHSGKVAFRDGQLVQYGNLGQGVNFSSVYLTR